MLLAELTVYQKNKKFFCVPLDSSQLTIGRSSKNDLILTGDQVSRHHAVIEKMNTVFWLRDMSTAGTFLNDHKLVVPTQLQPGNTIAIADWQLVFASDSSVQAAETERKETQITKLTEELPGDTTQILKFEPDALFYKQLKPCLIIEDAKNGNRTCLVKKNRLVVGSAKNCDILLDDEFVSKYHAEFRLSDLGFHVVDLDSTNGTFVNNFKIKECYLKGGEKIELGNSRIVAVFEEGSSVTLDPFHDNHFCGIYAQSHSMRLLFSKIQKIAATDMTTLIVGETGSGKEMVARALHDLSDRRHKPYLVINCGAITTTLIESELFGHEKGAFTGADQRHLGAFEQANAGTVFLDEIGELPLELQSKLLRVLEYQTLRRVGGSQDIKINVRIIAATHRDLPSLVEHKAFREDLFYRLYVICLKLPPLRERKEDIPLLTKVFIDKCSPDKLLYLDQSSIEKLKNHSWPGNVRELKNTIMRAIAFCQSNIITASDIEFLLPHKGPAIEMAENADPATALPQTREEVMAPEALRAQEKSRIEGVLKTTNHDKTRAAKLLGMGRSTLFRKMKSLGIALDDTDKQE